VVFLLLCLAVFADEDGKRFLGKLNPVTAGLFGGPLDTNYPACTRTRGDPIAVGENWVSKEDSSGNGGVLAADSTGGNGGKTVQQFPNQNSPAAALSVPAAKSSSASAPQPSQKPDLKGQELTAAIAEKYPSNKFIPREVASRPWSAGENLVFSVEYGFYRAGTATMSVLDAEYVNGGLSFHIRTTAESNDFISSFYKVRDKVDSYVDIKGIFSRRFEKRLREGGYSSDEYVDLYHDRLIALSTKQKRALVEIPLYVQDILSTLYYIRTFDLKVGRNETIETYADGKVYPLKVLVYKKEKVEVPAGTFMCVLIEPVLKSEGIFRQKGRLLVWLTDDKNRIPVKMTSKVAIGNIAAKLVSYRKSVE
jgi:hypothetical protein